MTPKAQATKEKNNKFDFIKIKNLYTSKDINKVKRQVIEWEGVFANHISDKDLIPRIYKQLL